MTSQVLNFLWLNLDLPAPPDPEGGLIREPLPAKYIENVRKAGKAHAKAQMVLWVDSKRLTERQMAYLKQSIEDGLPNVHLKDLRGIPAYDQEPLYNEAETNPHWRDGGQRSLIWRQVNAAKVLVSLQGDFDQVFFADLDHAHLGITSLKAQRKLKKHGLFIGGNSDYEGADLENKLWGFNHTRRGFFERYYATALKAAHEGCNAYIPLLRQVRKELEKKEEISKKEICLLIAGDGSSAEQPGHEWRSGYDRDGSLSRAWYKAVLGRIPFLKSRFAPAKNGSTPSVLKFPAV